MQVNGELEIQQNACHSLEVSGRKKDEQIESLQQLVERINEELKSKVQNSLEVMWECGELHHLFSLLSLMSGGGLETDRREQD